MAPPDVLTGLSLHARLRREVPVDHEARRQAAMAAAGSGVQLQNSVRRSFGGTAGRRPKQGGDFLGKVVLISSADHNDHVRQHVGERTAQGAGPRMRRDGQPSVMMGLGTPRPCNENGAGDSQTM